ncbi:IclR family transcriptional regulator [Leucobacter sp. wl10]|uniref:IclR family transcriptional regulator n=1 Tax=Leucobacter sp. wl10 TaxID=2304677 RepID=UPI000E5B33E0|nr:IclR family transcriptional regulator [Leucobacter sp. wl10]RGE16304.1 IclR family transcriptional regulator [Leucobacter sp. wl10]
MSETKTGQGPADSTTARVAEVLLAFAGSKEPIGITDIARATGLSKAVVHRIVQTLCASGFLWQNHETRKYQVGFAAFSLVDSANQTSKFRRHGMEVLANLAETTGETTTLSGRIGHRRVYVGQVESRQLVRISVEVGAAHPLTIGASGAAILAFLPEDEVEAVLNAPVPAMSATTITEPELLRERLRAVRRDGFARTTGERVRDSTSFAAPVRNRFDEVIGAISVAALTSRLTHERERALAAQAIEAADALSGELKTPLHH